MRTLSRRSLLGGLSSLALVACTPASEAAFGRAWLRAMVPSAGIVIPTLTPGSGWYASAATASTSLAQGGIYPTYGDRYKNEALPGSGWSTANPEPNQDDTLVMGSGWPERAVGGISIARLNRAVPNYTGYAGAYPIEKAGGRCITAFAACGDPTRGGIQSVQVNFENNGWTTLTQQSLNPDDGTFGYVFRLSTGVSPTVFGIARFYVRLVPVNGVVKLLGPFDVFMNDAGVFNRANQLVVQNTAGVTSNDAKLGIVYCDLSGSDSSGTGSLAAPFATPNHAQTKVADGGYIYCNPGDYTDSASSGRNNTKPIIVMQTPGTTGTVTIQSQYQSTLAPALKGTSTANKWTPSAMHVIYRGVSLRIIGAFAPYSQGFVHLQNVNYRDPDGTETDIGGCYGPDTDT